MIFLCTSPIVLHAVVGMISQNHASLLHTLLYYKAGPVLSRCLLSTLFQFLLMENLIGPLSQATLLWNNILSNNASASMNSLQGLSSYGPLTTSGFSGATFSHSAGGKAVCVSGIIDVPVIATTIDVLYTGPANNYELTEFITGFIRRSSNLIANSLGDTKPINSTFEIYSKLCVPVDADEKTFTSVQFLTHGGTLDNTYWDFALEYSYVDAAAAKGYATFSYDRLGSGQSVHPDPLQVVQVPLQVSLAHELITKLKAGSIGGMAFSKVVGIGHSLGAALTQGVSRLHADDLDAVVLMGHSGFFEGSGTGFAAAAQQIANTLPDRPELKDLPNGYYTLGPVEQALQFAFFYWPHFDEESKLCQVLVLGCGRSDLKKDSLLTAGGI